MTPEEDPILKRYLELAFLDDSRDVLVCAVKYCDRKTYTEHARAIRAFLDLEIKPKDFSKMIADFAEVLGEYAAMVDRGLPS